MNIPRTFTRPVRIGSGSFSTVYRAFQSKMERPVVLKILPLINERKTNNIENEVRVLSSMRLPCVPQIFDIIRFRKRFIIVMEWIRGIPLSSLLESDLNSEWRMVIASAIIGSLAILHKNKVAHCDLKPENIIITSDFRIFFADFGFSRIHNTVCSSHGIIQGTPAFMAPELWSSLEKIDYLKVDMFALGILLHKLIGDSLPSFAAELTSITPEQRIDNCVLFEKKWCANFPITINSQEIYLHIAAAVDEYTARMLLSGARELYEKKRFEEAYSLLTESLNIWPDNTEALEYIQSKFAAPIMGRRKKRTFHAIAALFVIMFIIFGAYLTGRKSFEPRDIIGKMIIQQNESKFLSLHTLSGKKESSQSFPVVLRNSGEGMDLIGTINIIVNSHNGLLLVDDNPVESFKCGDVSIQLKIGTHRIEWFDSTTQHRFGETIEILPFENKTVTLKRFFHENGS